MNKDNKLLLFCFAVWWQDYTPLACELFPSLISLGTPSTWTVDPEP